MTLKEQLFEVLDRNASDNGTVKQNDLAFSVNDLKRRIALILIPHGDMRSDDGTVINNDGSSYSADGVQLTPALYDEDGRWISSSK
jgi:hypothetical protein